MITESKRSEQWAKPTKGTEISLSSKPALGFERSREFLTRLTDLKGLYEVRCRFLWAGERFGSLCI